jgi:hypothetical protein
MRHQPILRRKRRAVNADHQSQQYNLFHTSPSSPKSFRQLSAAGESFVKEL